MRIAHLSFAGRIRYKRLEEGTFRFPAAQAGVAGVQIKASEMAMLLEGIDLKSIKRSPRLKTKNN
jgi:transposase